MEKEFIPTEEDKAIHNVLNFIKNGNSYPWWDITKQVPELDFAGMSRLQEENLIQRDERYNSIKSDPYWKISNNAVGISKRPGGYIEYLKENYEANSLEYNLKKSTIKSNNFQSGKGFVIATTIAGLSLVWVITDSICNRRDIRSLEESIDHQRDSIKLIKSETDSLKILVKKLVPTTDTPSTKK